MDNETKQMFEMILKKLDSMEESQKEMKESQNRIEQKLNSVYEHTAKISEDITETNMKLDDVIDDIDFLKHKEHKTEEDLYKLKKKQDQLSIAKSSRA